MECRTPPGAITGIRARAARTLSRAAGVDDTPAAHTVLGDEHPLTCACEAFDRLVRDSRVVGAALIGSVLVVIEGARWAAAMVLSATIVLVIVGCIAAGLGQRRRDHALDLIADGQETIPLAPVQRERLRLLARRTRDSLADTVDRMVDEALRRPTSRATRIRPVYQRTVVPGVAADLRAVSRLIRTELTSARGLALTERLLRYGTSTLYGDDVSPLRAELRRILAALGSG